MKVLLYVASAGLALHGLIHLMGFVAYWPLAEIKELPYKTAVLEGRWEVGAVGMKIYAVLWLVAALSFLIGIGGLLSDQAWWRPVMVGAVVFSTALVALDWTASFRGAIINGVILALAVLTYLIPGLVPTR